MTGEEIGGYGIGGGALAMLGLGLRWLLFTFIPSVQNREEAVFKRLETQGAKFTASVDAVEKAHAAAMDKVVEHLGEIKYVMTHCPHNSCPLGLHDPKDPTDGILSRQGSQPQLPRLRKDKDKEA